MARGQMGAGGSHREFVLYARDGDARPERKRLDRRQLDRRPRKRQRAQRRNLVRGSRANRRERIRRQPADVGIAFELSPGPSFVVCLVDGDAFALQRLGIERRVVRRRAAERRLRIDDFARRAFNLRPRRGQPRVAQRGNSFALAASTSPNFSTASAPFTVRWITTLRRSFSSRRRATRPSLPIVSSARVITGLVTPSFFARPRTVCGG